MKTSTKVIIGSGIVGVAVVLYFMLQNKGPVTDNDFEEPRFDTGNKDGSINSGSGGTKAPVSKRLIAHRERQEAERLEQERLQREREERNEEGLLYLSRGSDNASQICNESTVRYVAKYKPPFARGVQIKGVRVNGNVDSFKIIKATNDAKAFVGKRIIIDDDDKLKSINTCN